MNIIVKCKMIIKEEGFIRTNKCKKLMYQCRKTDEFLRF